MMYDDLPGLGDEGESVTLTRMRARLVRGLALSTLPRPSWLVEDLLPRPSVAFIYGPPKSGKSFIAIDLAASVACGRSWCGKKTTGGTVLYVVGEGISGVVLRQEAWAEYHGETDALDGIRWHPGRVNLTNLDDVAALTAIATELRPDLVVIDTLARCAAGMDENSTRDAGMVVEALDTIRDASGATVCVVHHAGKDRSKGMRGSSALLGAADVTIEVSGGTGRVRLEVAEAKDFASGHVVNFGMEAVAGSVVLIEGGQSDPRAGQARAFEAWTALSETATDEGLATSAWRDVAGMSDSTFFRARKTLVDRGHVVNVGTPKMPRYRLGVGTP